MQIIVNGERREIDDALTVRDLVVALGFGDAPVAVERNRVIVPRAEHERTQLREGDELEVVHFVGGG
jgi:sulfur carrier protein